MILLFWGGLFGRLFGVWDVAGESFRPDRSPRRGSQSRVPFNVLGACGVKSSSDLRSQEEGLRKWQKKAGRKAEEKGSHRFPQGANPLGCIRACPRQMFWNWSEGGDCRSFTEATQVESGGLRSTAGVAFLLLPCFNPCPLTCSFCGVLCGGFLENPPVL